MPTDGVQVQGGTDPTEDQRDHTRVGKGDEEEAASPARRRLDGPHGDEHGVLAHRHALRRLPRYRRFPGGSCHSGITTCVSHLLSVRGCPCCIASSPLETWSLTLCHPWHHGRRNINSSAERQKVSRCLVAAVERRATHVRLARPFLAAVCTCHRAPTASFH